MNSISFRSWATSKLPVSQTVACLLLLSAASVAAWLPPQTRARLAKPFVQLVSAPTTRTSASPRSTVPYSTALHLKASTSPRIRLASFRVISRVSGAIPTFTVSSTGDGDDAKPGDGICQTSSADGATCTLRAAITESNALGGATIGFNIPGAGEQVITLTTTLPNISVPVTINGYSQGGKANTLDMGNDANLLVRLNGSQLLANQGGLIFDIGSAGSTLRGLSITDVRAGSGVRLRSDGNTVAGCSITGNGFDGITIEGGKNNTLGGPNVGDRNTLSGNTFDGVRITPDAQGGGGTGNTISNSYVGTNAAGSAAQPNNQGIEISTGGNTIGSTSGLASNIIAANQGTGIALVQGDGNTIIGNLIGSDATNTNKLGNLGAGIQIGTTQNGGSASNNNIIGTVAGGNSIFGNGGQQGRSGVEVLNGTGNSIRGNRINLNGALGIDLSAPGDTVSNRVTPNDAGDADTGANNLQNFPTISGVAGQNISGTLNSLPSTSFRIEFFASDAADSSGFGQGQNYLGFVNTTTGADGNTPSFSFASPTAIAGQFIAATATRLMGTGNTLVETSEFSPAFKASSSSSADISLTSSPNPSTAGDSVTFTALVSPQSGNRAPSGFVTFQEGNVVLGTVPLTITRIGTFSVAEFSTSTVGVGSHIITATYSGDGFFGGLTSTPLTQVVNAADACPTVVTNTSDSGAGSLRSAIDCSNTKAGKQTISFNIPVAGVQTITLQSSLPGVTDPAVIDGFTQPDSQANSASFNVGINAKPLIEITGAPGVSAISGFRVSGGDTTMRGLVINNVITAIQFVAKSGNSVEGCFIGTDATGLKARPNQLGGILLSSTSGNVIGGATPDVRNLISGNDGAGIRTNEFRSGEDFGNTVRGNFIGTDVTGTKALANKTGVQLSGNGSTIGADPGANPDTVANSRNLISGNGTGLLILSGTNISVAGNLIGTDLTHTLALPNTEDGIAVSADSSNNIIGAAGGRGNQISGNGGSGIRLGGKGNQVIGNFIGTDGAGAKALANGGDGLTFSPGSTGNFVGGGGSAGSATNLISGNAGNGIGFDSRGAVSGSQQILSNFIGTDQAGAKAIPNAGDGIHIEGSPNNIIGGTVQGTTNVISGNGGSGIVLLGSDGTKIQSNLIGTQNDARSALPNGGDGIQISGSNNVIGGANGANTIAFNGSVHVLRGAGISISGGTGNNLQGNFIFSNQKLGIDLVGGVEDANGVTAGVTANDAGDADTGANNLQNYPVIDLVTNSPTFSSGISSTVQGTLNSLPNSQFSIELYVSDSADPSGFGEGAIPVRSGITVYTDAAGNAQFQARLVGTDTTGKFVTATATRIVNNVAGDTSEFSRAVKGISDDPSSCPIEVTNTDDAGAGSFRAAIGCFNGNLTDTARTISFNIPGEGVHTIRPLSALPLINGGEGITASGGVGTVTPSVIDGYTQPGSSANTLAQGDNAKILIELDGTLAGNSNGLSFSQGGTADISTVIRGLVINRFAGAGVLVSELASKTFTGCFIGTDVTGTIARPNGVGIFLPSSRKVVVGGKTPQERNVIAGNTREGIALSGGLGFANTIQGNFIGTDATGTKALPNSIGIGLSVEASANTIQTNLISGNTGAGIDINTGKTNFISGNFIGTDATGSAIVPNGGDGIRITDSPTNLIFATKSDGGNVIAGNAGNGLFITGGASTGTIIQGNFIGTDAAGKAGLGNKGNGILFSGAAPGHTIGDALPATLSTQSVGPTSSGNGNTIAGNGGAGVAIDLGTFTSCHRKSILGNSIYGNGKLGIDLKGGTEDKYGVTANQPVSNQGDQTSGPNALQNYPILSGATVAGGNVTIAGTLVSAKNATFRIEFFSNAVADPSGFGEGQTFLGFQSVTTDGNGSASFSKTLPLTGAGRVFSATATDAVGNTSEFSVSLTNTTTTLTSSPRPSEVGKNVTFSATVAPGAGATKPTGTVTFKDGTTTLGSGTLNNGVATFSTTTLSQGARSITATYSGDANFNASTSAALTQTVNAAASADVALLNPKSTPNPVAPGAQLSFNATINNSGPNTAANVTATIPVPANTTFVSFSSTDSAFFCTTPAVGGTGNVVCSTADHAPDASVGQSGMFTLVVKVNSNTPNGTIITDSASVTSTTPDPNTSNNTASASATVQTPIVKAPTTITLQSSRNPSPFGQSVTFTATVTPTALTNRTKTATKTVTKTKTGTAVLTASPTGTVTFKDGTTPIGTGTLDAQGMATFTTSALSVGTHPITASYSGDSAYSSSASAVVSQVVTAAPVLPTLSINDVALSEGNSGTKNFTFTVTLSPAASQTVTVKYATANGTATAGSDYTTNAGTLTFAPGITSQTIPVTVTGDTTRESDETFTVNLSGQINAALGKATGTGTIQNDDFVADLSVTQSASPTSVPRGGEVVFTIAVKNNGPDAASNVTLSDVLPAGATLVSSVPGATQNDGTLTYALGSIASGATTTVSLRLRAPNSVGTLTNSVSVSQTGATDPSAPNNAASSSVAVTSGAPAFGFRVGKLINVGPYSPSLYHPGAHFIQDITITNTGTASASAPLQLVLNGLPSSISLVGASGTATNGAPFINVPLSLGTLAVGQSVKVRLEFRLSRRDKPAFSPSIGANSGAQ